MNNIRWPLVLPVVLVFSLFAAGCDREGPAERTGERLDRGADRAGDSLERAGDRTRDRIDR